MFACWRPTVCMMGPITWIPTIRHLGNRSESCFGRLTSNAMERIKRIYRDASSITASNFNAFQPTSIKGGGSLAARQPGTDWQTASVNEATGIRLKIGGWRRAWWQSLASSMTNTTIRSKLVAYRSWGAWWGPAFGTIIFSCSLGELKNDSLISHHSWSSVNYRKKFNCSRSAPHQATLTSSALPHKWSVIFWILFMHKYKQSSTTTRAVSTTFLFLQE